ncbi:MAG: hypothetical protein ACLQU4_06690 [Limisphaerales bacterium]
MIKNLVPENAVKEGKGFDETILPCGEQFAVRENLRSKTPEPGCMSS